MRVLGLDGGVGVAQILAEAVVATDFVEDVLRLVVVLFIVWAGKGAGVAIRNFMRELELHADQIESARAQVESGESIAFTQAGISEARLRDELDSALGVVAQLGRERQQLG